MISIVGSRIDGSLLPYEMGPFISVRGYHWKQYDKGFLSDDPDTLSDALSHYISMNIPGRWLALSAAVILTLLVPSMPPGMAGFFLIIGSALILIRTGDSALSAAIFILGILSLFGLLPVFVLCATVLIVATRELIFFYSRGRPAEYGLSLIGGLLVAALVMEYTSGGTWLSAVVGVTVAILLHSILQKNQYALGCELIGVAMVMLLIEDLEYQVDFPLVATAAFISFGFAYFAYRLKTADIPGLFSAALVGILLIVFAGISWFFAQQGFDQGHRFLRIVWCAQANSFRARAHCCR